MHITVITAHYSKTNPFILEAYRSLCAQEWQDWEWVIIANNGGTLPEALMNDARIRVIPAGPDEPPCIGYFKRLACQEAKGEVIVELDADDLLTEDCLSAVAEAFEKPEVNLVYSNCAEFHHETWAPNSYNAYFGWVSRPWVWHGHTLIETVAFEPSPHMMRMVWWCPNHVRAWRANAYWAVGGHDGSMGVGDDHDLMCRFYLGSQKGQIVHLDRCLYLYRIHEANTVKTANKAIQEASWGNYNRYVRRLAEHWCDLENLPKVDLGARFNKPAGYIGFDMRPGPGVDHVCDLRQGIPCEDSSIGLIRAYDFLEHLPDPVFTMNEIWRVLVPGGWLLARIPSTDGRGAFQDPTHISFWNENSFWYYTSAQYAAFAPEFKGRFQVSRVVTIYQDAWHEEHRICHVDAQLIALKPGYKPVGGVLWPS